VNGKTNVWIAGQLLTVACAVLVHAATLWWPRTVDDAYITLRYSRNLADGLGPVYNAGERVEGYSTPAWMFLAAALVVSGLDPVPIVKLAGLAASIGLLLVLYRGLRRSAVPKWGAALATLWLGASFVLQIWSVSGMETTTYALFFFCGLMQLVREDGTDRRALTASLCLAAAALTRPEGLAFWLLGLGLYVGRDSRAARRSAIYAAPGLILAAHMLWRTLYYGSALPNTYFAKTGGGLRMWEQGLSGLERFVTAPAHSVWILAAILGGIVGMRRPATRRAVAIVGGAIVLHLLYVVSVGDDGLVVHRFHVPVLAPLSFLAGQLFRADGARRRSSRLLASAGVIAAAVAIPSSVLTFHERLLPALTEVAAPYLDGNAKLGRHLAATRDPETLIAVASAGAIPYFSRLPTIDMYGLNDAHIAHGPFPSGVGGRMMKWDTPYVLSREPDLIVINRGYFEAGDPRISEVLRNPAQLIVAPMDADLFEHVRRDGNYRPDVIVFPDGSRYFVFARIAPVSAR